LQKFGGWFDTWAVGMKDFPLPSNIHTKKQKKMEAKFKTGDVVRNNYDNKKSIIVEVLTYDKLFPNPFNKQLCYTMIGEDDRPSWGYCSVVESTHTIQESLLTSL